MQRRLGKKNTPKDPSFLKISAACGKIEQFIESIFPTPTDPITIERQRQLAATGETPEEAAAAKKEMFLLIAAVVGTLTVISAFMIFLAWLAGARFDLAFQDMKGTLSKVANMGELQASTTPLVEKVAEAAHGEL